MDDQTSPSIPCCLQHKITLKGLLTCICTLLVLARVVLFICWYRSIIAPCILFLINRWIIHSENKFFYNYHASKYTKDLFCRCELHFMTFVCTSTKHNVIEWCIFQTLKLILNAISWRWVYILCNIHNHLEWYLTIRESSRGKVCRMDLLAWGLLWSSSLHLFNNHSYGLTATSFSQIYIPHQQIFQRFYTVMYMCSLAHCLRTTVMEYKN